jgi:hypothetical protein
MASLNPRIAVADVVSFLREKRTLYASNHLPTKHLVQLWVHFEEVQGGQLRILGTLSVRDMGTATFPVAEAVERWNNLMGKRCSVERALNEPLPSVEGSLVLTGIDWGVGEAVTAVGAHLNEDWLQGYLHGIGFVREKNLDMERVPANILSVHRGQYRLAASAPHVAGHVLQFDWIEDLMKKWGFSQVVAEIDTETVPAPGGGLLLKHSPEGQTFLQVDLDYLVITMLARGFLLHQCLDGCDASNHPV